MCQLINGKDVAEHIKQLVKSEIESTSTDATLAVIVVGENQASKIYVNNKKKACNDVGIKSLEYTFPSDISEDELTNFIDNLNESKDINGILVQLPLPEHINADAVLGRIEPSKDVDGFTAINTGHLWLGKYDLVPCTAMGIIELLDYYGIEIAGKNCVVVGRSNIVGKPVAALLLERNATVTICHSKTQNLSEVTSKADILIVAIGKPKFVTIDMVKEGAVVIDVGINRDENGKLCGDVDFEGVKNKVATITPVPGGVGPMTIAMLMKNTIVAAKNQLQ